MSEQAKYKILIVDDVDYNIAILRNMLKKLGYQTVAAHSGFEALELVEKEEPDLILLDVMMPDLDGFDVCRRLRAQLKTQFMPVVMVTALTDQDSKVSALEAGADDFISKPVDKVELTARIRSLLRIKKQREEMEELKRDFMAMLVHDLRSPMVSIRGFIKLLQDDSFAEDKDTRLEFLEVMESSSTQMLGLINNILDLSKLEAGKLELKITETDFNKIIKKSFRQFKPMATLKNIEMIYDLSEVIIAGVDKAKISQVIMNLLNNAVKFTPNGGQIELQTVNTDGFITVRVRDSGPGIAREEIEHLFKKYSQAETGKLAQGGTGLGLAISKLIVEAHCGEIGVESESGQGSLFWFTIPANNVAV